MVWPLTTSRAGVIRSSTTHPSELINYTEAKNLQLLNTSGTPTHFPRNQNFQTTIPDLSFASGGLYNMTQEWSCDPGEGGDSDHALITTLLQIHPPVFTPTRIHSKTNWEVFTKIVTALSFTSDDWITAATTNKAALRLSDLILEAMNGSIPWSKVTQRSKGWWNSDITSLKRRLATEYRWTRRNIDDQSRKEECQHLIKLWRKAIREAQWAH